MGVCSLGGLWLYWLAVFHWTLYVWAWKGGSPRHAWCTVREADSWLVAVRISVYTHTHIYIYTHAVEWKLGPKLIKTWSKCFFFCFPCLFLSSSFCKGNEILFKKEEDNNYHYWVKTWSNLCCATYLDQVRLNLGPSFDSTFLTFLGHFFKIWWNHYFIALSANIPF